MIDYEPISDSPARDESMEIIAEIDSELRSCLRRLDCDGFMLAGWFRPQLSGRYASCGSIIFEMPSEPGEPGEGNCLVPLARLAAIVINTAKQWGIPQDVFKAAVCSAMEGAEVAFLTKPQYDDD